MTIETSNLHDSPLRQDLLSIRMLANKAGEIDPRQSSRNASGFCRHCALGARSTVPTSIQQPLLLNQTRSVRGAIKRCRSDGMIVKVLMCHCEPPKGVKQSPPLLQRGDRFPSTGSGQASGFALLAMTHPLHFYPCPLFHTICVHPLQRNCSIAFNISATIVVYAGWGW